MTVPWWAWGAGAVVGALLFQRRARAGGSTVTDVAGDDSEYPGLDLVDLRGQAPAEYIVRDRPAEEVTAAILHQTAFSGWKPNNPNWAKIKSHFVVRRDGKVQINFDPTKRLRYGSNKANAFGITIEHEGNYPNAAGVWWEGDKFGEDHVEDAPAQVAASRRLLEILSERYPIEHVYAHRQWDAGKTNCPGPDLWREVGEYAVKQLGLSDGGPGWHAEGGLSIPESWR